MSQTHQIQLDLCIALARYAHEGQVDKSGRPYIAHPLRVMEAVQGIEDQMAAVLHDVVEDTWVTLELLTQLRLPSPVLHAVECLTKRPQDTHALYLERVLADPIATRVKFADTLDNLRPDRIATWSARDPEAATRYHAAAIRRLERLCQRLGRPVPTFVTLVWPH